MEYFEIQYIGKPSKIVFTEEDANEACLAEEDTFAGELDKVVKFKQLGSEPDPNTDELVETIWTAEEGFLNDPDFLDTDEEDINEFELDFDDRPTIAGSDINEYDWDDEDDEDLTEADCKIHKAITHPDDDISDEEFIEEFGKALKEKRESKCCPDCGKEICECGNNKLVEEVNDEDTHIVDYVEYKHSYCHFLEPQLRKINYYCNVQKKPVSYIKAIIRNILSDPECYWTEKERWFMNEVKQHVDSYELWKFIKNSIAKAHDIYVYVDNDGELVDELNTEFTTIPKNI